MINKTRSGTCRVTADRLESVLKSLWVRVRAVNNAPSLRRQKSLEIEDEDEHNNVKAISLTRESLGDRVRDG